MTDAPTEREEEGGWAKLRRRKVVQWGVAYAAAAWTLLQVIEFLAETYDWPPAIRQIAVPTLSLASLFVLVFAWHHGDKGQQKVSRQELALLASLFLAAGGVLWWVVARLDANAWRPAGAGVVIPHAVPTDAPSVAVLPFVNMSSDPEQEYFADGLSEEILNSLARIPGLFVPARTSSFQFKGKAGDVAKFAAMLGVAHVLEGSVRKSGDRVRITAQLVNAADGYHVWSHTYDRELKDVFVIQGEIANAISEALRVRLSTQQRGSAVQSRPTESTAAYEAYLLGRYESGKRDHESIRKSIAHFKKAVALDPNFADAYARLAAAMLEVRGADPIFYSPQQFAEFLAEAQPLLDRAMTLAPGRTDVLAAAGILAAYRDQPELALEYFNKALAINPSDGEVLAERSTILRVTGHAAEAIPASYEAIKQDPLSLTALWEHFRILRKYGPRDEIGSLIDRIAMLDDAQGQLARAILASERGDRVTAVRHSLALIDLKVAQGTRLEEEVGWIGPLVDAFSVFDLREEVELATKAYPTFALMTFGDFSKAIALLRPLAKENANYRSELAYALYLTGDYQGATAIFEKCMAERNTGCRNKAATWLTAADAARRAGHAQRARDWRDEAERALQADANAGAIADGAVAFNWALLQAFDGDEAQAAANAIIAIETDPLVFLWLPLDPALAGVAARPDVQAAIRAQEALVARQRVEVLDMLCGPNPVSRNYKPVPETCAKWKSSDART